MHPPAEQADGFFFFLHWINFKLPLCFYRDLQGLLEAKDLWASQDRM